MKEIDQCHLCGEKSPLTFEHVPPQKAFNAHRAMMYYGKQIVDRGDIWPWQLSDKKKGKQIQGGVGWHTLCARCNNNTGNWYATSFVDFTHKAYQELDRLRKGSPANDVKLTLGKIYPLRVVKQILTMFFSVNSPLFSVANPELKKLILGRTNRGINTQRYAIYIYM